MPWQVLIGLSVIASSIGVLLQRVLVKESNSRPIAFAIFFPFLTGLLITLVGFVTTDMIFPDIRPIIGNIFLMIIFYGSANILIFKSLKETEASRFTIVFSTRGLFTILASSVLLRELLTPQQFIGALFIFFSVVLVSLESAKKIIFTKGDALALFAAMGYGFANTNDRYLLQYFDVYPFMTISFLAPSLFTALVYLKELKYVSMFIQPTMLRKILVLCLVYAFAAITFFMALKTTPSSSQVAALNLMSVVITVVLSIVLLKERKNIIQKLFGSVLCFLGLLLVS